MLGNLVLRTAAAEFWKTKSVKSAAQFQWVSSSSKPVKEQQGCRARGRARDLSVPTAASLLLGTPL